MKYHLDHIGHNAHDSYFQIEYFHYTLGMILFINPISENIWCTILDTHEVVETKIISKWDDFGSFPDVLVSLVEQFQVWEIWCIVWPWAFTRMRIVTLAINAVSMSKKIVIKWCHFFEIIDSENPILRANDSEYIILNENNLPTLTEKELLNTGKTYTGYGQENDFTDWKKLIQYNEDWSKIREVFHHTIPVEFLTPIYLKDPHITWSKKNTFPSSKRTNK